MWAGEEKGEEVGLKGSALNWGERTKPISLYYDFFETTNIRTICRKSSVVSLVVHLGTSQSQSLCI